ncbi:MAG: response regulator [Tenuifilaceae bacterium]|jgi:response regulator RpfG family c-di-GMP phosphodiesterase|nr:response regulator [Tenuifilaceae bacterium]
MKSQTTILYVDDEPINLMLFAQVFKEKYSVITAESGYAGLNLIEKNPGIDVVISDMRMPGMNGIEFIQKAKELNSNIYYYILTSYDITPEIDNAIKTGLIDKYFQKPFNFLEIEIALTERLNSLI